MERHVVRAEEQPDVGDVVIANEHETGRHQERRFLLETMALVTNFVLRACLTDPATGSVHTGDDPDRFHRAERAPGCGAGDRPSRTYRVRVVAVPAGDVAFHEQGVFVGLMQQFGGFDRVRAEGVECAADILQSDAAVMAAKTALTRRAIQEQPLGMTGRMLAVAILAAVVAYCNIRGMGPWGAAGACRGSGGGGVGGLLPARKAMTGDAQARTAVVHEEKFLELILM